MGFDLTSIKKQSRDNHHPILCLYGGEGVGKTSFAATAPNPIFLATEDGLVSVPGVDAFPIPTTFEDARTACSTLAKQDHDYKTLVIDTVDWLEPLIQREVAAQNKKDNIEDIGYGKGYVLAAEAFRKFMAGLDLLRKKKNMNIILLAHMTVKKYDSPDTDPYDRFGLKLNKHVNAIVMEACDCVLFANWRIQTTKADGGFNRKITKAIGDSERVLYTSHSPTHDAKNRYSMPDQIEMHWNALEEAIKEKK
jgi:hypothetical protein